MVKSADPKSKSTNVCGFEQSNGQTNAPVAVGFRTDTSVGILKRRFSDSPIGARTDAPNRPTGIRIALRINAPATKKRPIDGPD